MADGDCDSALSARIYAELMKERGFLSPSRGSDDHVYFKLDRPGIDAEEAVERIRASGWR